MSRIKNIYYVLCFSVMLATILVVTSAFIEGGFNDFKYTILMNSYGEWALELAIMLLVIPGCFSLFITTIKRLRDGEKA